MGRGFMGLTQSPPRGVGSNLAQTALGCAGPLTCGNTRLGLLWNAADAVARRGVCRPPASVLVRALSEGVGFRCTRCRAANRNAVVTGVVGLEDLVPLYSLSSSE